MGKLVDLTGKRFGQLLVIKKAGRRKGKTRWECKCDCGKTTVVDYGAIAYGKNISCGCYRYKQLGDRQRIHGFCKTRFYKIFKGLRSRCNNYNQPKYKSYGGRGIKCEWISFIDFKSDMYTSYQKHLKEFGEKETTIDRIDNDGNYCKENCRWATLKEQNINTQRSVCITHNGLTKTISEWEEFLNFPSSLLRGRLRRGWSINRAMTTTRISKSK